MKKTLMLAVACAIGATAASAQMQGGSHDSAGGMHTPPGGMRNTSGAMHSGDMHNSTGDMHDRSGPMDRHDGTAIGPDRHMNGGGWNKGRVHDNMHGNPPAHWNRGRMAWSGHARRCAARYRSYNPRTDMFMIRIGVARRCML